MRLFKMYICVHCCMIGINDIVTGVLGTIIGAVMIGLVAVPIVNSVISEMGEGNDTVATLLGIAVVLLCVTLIAFPIYMLTRSSKF